MMRTSQRDLRDYISEISERADVRAGFPLPLGTQERGGGVNFAIFSRDASRVRLELFDRPEDGAPAQVIDLDSARNRTGDVWHVWVEGIAPGQLYAYRVDGPYEPTKDIVSISTGFSSTPSLLRSRGCPRGILHQHVDTTRRRRSKIWLSRSGTIPARCRNAYLSTIPSSGMETRRPASVVEDRHLRNACSRFYHSSQVGRGASGNLPRADGTDSLSHNLGGDRCGTDARAGVQ